MANLICSAILIIPWVAIPIYGMGDPFRIPKEVFLNLFFLSVISCAFWRGINITYRNKYLALLIGWIFFTFFIHWYIPILNTMGGVHRIKAYMLSSFTNILLGTSASFILLSTLKTEDFKKIAKAICLSASLAAIVGIMQAAGFDPFVKLWSIGTNYNSGYCIAMMDNPNLSGALLALSIPFFFLFKGKRYIAGLILCVLALIFTKTLMPILAVFVGIFILLFLFYRRLMLLEILIPFVFFMSGAFLLSRLTYKKILFLATGRKEIWSQGLKIFKENTLLGNGLGIIKTFGIKYEDRLVNNLHNDWLELAVCIGGIGVFLLLLVIINSFRNFNYDTNNKLGIAYLSSFVIFLILMAGLFPLESAPVALLGLTSFYAMEKIK